MDSKTKVVLVLVAVAVVLVGLQAGLAVLQDDPGGEDERTAKVDSLSRDDVMQGLAGLLAPLARPVKKRRIDDRGCGLRGDGRIDLEGGNDRCELDVRPGDEVFAKLDLRVRRGRIAVAYRPNADGAKKSEEEEVGTGDSNLVPVMEDGGRVWIRCAEAPCRVEVETR